MNRGGIRLKNSFNLVVLLSKIMESFLFLGDFGAFSFVLQTFLESPENGAAAPAEERNGPYRHFSDG